MPPSVFTPLVPLHYNTHVEGKGALPGQFYAIAAIAWARATTREPGYTHMGSFTNVVSESLTSWIT